MILSWHDIALIQSWLVPFIVETVNKWVKKKASGFIGFKAAAWHSVLLYFHMFL